jgi:hypothetical protein
MFAVMATRSKSAKTPEQPRLRKLPPRVQREIAGLKLPALIRYHDGAGNKLHIEAVRAELARRRAELQTPGPKEHHLLRKQRLSRATRILGAPIESHNSRKSKNGAVAKSAPAPKPAVAKKRVPVLSTVARKRKA